MVLEVFTGQLGLNEGTRLREYKFKTHLSPSVNRFAMCQAMCFMIYINDVI